MKTLPVYLSKQRQEFGLPFKVASYTVLEFDASLASDQLNVIHDAGSHTDPSSGYTIYVHCGLDVGSSCFKLEEVAFNDLNKTPRGGQSSYSSSLPVSWMTDRLSSAGWGTSVTHSNYISRSVYNSVYYSSMNYCASSFRKHCLFINCPPLTLRDEQEQLCFIKDCLLVLVESVQNDPLISSAYSAKINSGSVSPVQTVLAQAEPNYPVSEGFYSNRPIPAEYPHLELHSFGRRMKTDPMAAPTVNNDGYDSFHPAREMSHKSAPIGHLKEHSFHPSQQDTATKRVGSPALSESGADWKVLFKNSTMTGHPGYTSYEEPVYKGEHNRQQIMQATALQSYTDSVYEPQHSISPVNIPMEPRQTKDGAHFGQKCKILLLVRADLIQSAGHMTLLCVQAAAKARREVETNDPESVYRWENDGNHCIIAAVNDDHEMSMVVQQAARNYLHIIMPHENTENVMAGVVSVGPALSGILLELSSELEIIE